MLHTLSHTRRRHGNTCSATGGAAVAAQQARTASQAGPARTSHMVTAAQALAALHWLHQRITASCFSSPARLRLGKSPQPGKISVATLLRAFLQRHALVVLCSQIGQLLSSSQERAAIRTQAAACGVSFGSRGSGCTRHLCLTAAAPVQQARHNTHGRDGQLPLSQYGSDQRMCLCCGASVSHFPFWLRLIIDHGQDHCWCLQRQPAALASCASQDTISTTRVLLPYC